MNAPKPGPLGVECPNPDCFASVGLCCVDTRLVHDRHGNGRLVNVNRWKHPHAARIRAAAQKAREEREK